MDPFDYIEKKNKEKIKNELTTEEANKKNNKLIHLLFLFVVLFHLHSISRNKGNIHSRQFGPLDNLSNYVILLLKLNK